MILGLGIDLLNKNRINNLLIKFKDKVIKKILSDKEILLYKDIINDDKKVSFISKRFSSKESFLKAIGIGLGRGITMKDITIINNELGKPNIIINQHCKNFLEKFYNKNFDKIKIDISITDENNLVNTIVIISEHNDE